MLRVGLTGGIGAGKSEVARALAGHGAVVIYADQLAREVVEPGTDGLREVVAAFGGTVLDPAGGLDRAALARAVFDNPPARRRLEGIIHPRVRARTTELTAAAPADAVVVNEVPLLVEVGLAPAYHLVVVVEAAEPVRVARLVRDRNLAGDQARARIRSQAGDAQRRAAADVLLANDGGVGELHAAVAALWRDRLLPYEDNLRHGRPAPRPPRAVIAEPDPAWPAQAERLLARIRRVAGEQAIRIDHIGPTAVPGLPATDLLDLQLVVADLPAAARLAGELSDAGMVRLAGDWCDHRRDGGRHPRAMAGSADPGRAADVHLRELGSPAWRDALLLRDWLRATPTGVAEYAASAAAQSPWIASALARADQWAGRSGWQP